MKKEFVIEVLEERIAPSACGGPHPHGNNGFGNGGDDGVPGNSANNNSPNADQKADDVVR